MTSPFTGVRHTPSGSTGALALALVLATGACAVLGDRMSPPPAALSAREARSDHGMVASGSVEATRAGVRILEAGGNAVDAAVAVAFALGVAEPGGSGLGGMTYIMVHLADGRSVAIDGTAPVPMGAVAEELQAQREAEGWYGYKTAAVPASLAALAHALETYGTMSLPQALDPAIAIAERGFRLSRGQVPWLGAYLDTILESEYLRHIVLRNGSEIGQPGDLICRPDLARTLRRIAAGGVASFYRGRIADEIEADMVRHGGFVRKADLASLRIMERQPIRSTYRDVEILAFPPPGAGGIVVEILNILETYPAAALGGDGSEPLHRLIESFRIARADHYSFTTATTRHPAGRGLPYLAKDFAAGRAALITPGRAIAGHRLQPRPPSPQHGDHTTHVSVADRFGNAVALSQTLGRQFGAKVATPGLGFPYNCLLESLEFENTQSPLFARPRGLYPTDLAPTLVLRDGQLMLALGSAGSERVPPVVAQVISNVVDQRMSLREAVAAARVLWGGTDPPKVYLEITGRITEACADSLEACGFEDVYRLRFPPRPIDLSFFGGVNAVYHDRGTGTFIGIGDPRRFGFALGPRL